MPKVSEAARSPAVEARSLPAVPPEPLSQSQSHSQASPKWHSLRTRFVIAVALGVALIVAATLLLVGPGRPAHHRPRVSFPASLRSYTLVYALPAEAPRIVRLDGSTLRDVPGDVLTNGALPLRVGDSVVFNGVVSATAYSLAKPFGGRAQPLVPAVGLLPSLIPQTVWAVQRVAPGPFSLQLVSVIADGPKVASEPIRIPDGYSPVGVLPTGLLLWEVDTQAAVLRVWKPGVVSGDAFVRTLGQAEGGVIRTSGDLVAWLDGSEACHAEKSCPLHISNAATGADHVVNAPDGSKFGSVGSFSPDGTRLAVFLVASTNGEQATQLFTIGASSGWSTLSLTSGGILPMSGDGPYAIWSPDGSWIFMCTGRLRALRVGSNDAFDLPYAGSCSFAVF